MSYKSPSPNKLPEGYRYIISIVDTVTNMESSIAVESLDKLGSKAISGKSFIWEFIQIAKEALKSHEPK